MKELKQNDYSTPVQKIFHLLSVKGEYKVIGSAKLSAIKYVNDYDLEEYITEPNSTKHYTNVLWKVFKEKFQQAEKNPNIFITDFKCGEINGVPVRWNKTNIKSGKQKVGTASITFQKCLLQKSVIKMDVVALINNIFTEFSENYYFTLGQFTNYENAGTYGSPHAPPFSKEVNTRNHNDGIAKREGRAGNRRFLQIQNGLLNEAQQYFRTGKLFKSLKRLFSYFLTKQVQPKLQELLVQFFNSEIGLLNKSKNELEILILVVENMFRKPNRKDIVNNLQVVKQNLNYITEVQIKSNLSESIDLICKRRNLKEIKEGIEVVKSYLQKKVNESTMPFLERHISLFKYIR